MVCRRCEVNKPESDFWRLRTKPKAVCKECETNATMFRLYGITLEDYERMFVEQSGVCAVCGVEPSNARLHIDHDHTSGVVRGLLCFNCNSILGKVNDDTEHLHALVAYLEDF